jgi:hypothetical protein
MLEKNNKSGNNNNNNTGNSNNNNSGNRNNSRRQVVRNNDMIPAVRLRDSDIYSHLVNKSVTSQCEDAKVVIDGKDICNNWHIRGYCYHDCPRSYSHRSLNKANSDKLKAYVEKLRGVAKNLPPNSLDFSNQNNNNKKRRYGNPERKY